LNFSFIPVTPHLAASTHVLGHVSAGMKDHVYCGAEENQQKENCDREA
jgi:hypothetical protein